MERNERWMTVDETAKYLKLCTISVLKAIKKGELKASRVTPKLWRVDREYIDKEIRKGE